MQRIVKTDDGIASRDIRSVAAFLFVGTDEDVLALCDLDDVVVARDSPQFVGFVPEDRIDGAHPRVRGIRIAAVQLGGK
jgi:hypothetical protein